MMRNVAVMILSGIASGITMFMLLASDLSESASDATLRDWAFACGSHAFIVAAWFWFGWVSRGDNRGN